jgi:hypothetical protein
MDLMDEGDAHPGPVGWLARALAVGAVMLALVVGVPLLRAAILLWMLP